MFLHAVFSLIILQIYPSNNAKYINKYKMGHDAKDTLKDTGKQQKNSIQHCTATK
jgi:hypothetical protein